MLKPSDNWEPTTELPETIFAAIGAVAVKHSVTERILSKIVYRLIGVDDVVGRLAVREPRTNEKLAMIIDLSERRGIIIKKEFLNLLNRDLPKVSKLRDELLHGVFFKHPDTGEFHIMRTRGKWRPPGMKAGSVKAIIHPSADKITAESVLDIARVISAMNESLLVLLHAVIEQMVHDEDEAGVPAGLE